MATPRNHFSIQLIDADSGEIIQTSGGFAVVLVAGSARKATIYSDADGTAKTNGFALNQGKIEFWTLASVASVDLVCMAPGGQFVRKSGIVSPGPSEIRVNTNARHQVAFIPFHALDQTADATETDTGFDFPLYTEVLPTPAVRVLAIDATETIEVGLKSSETNGDLDGFIDAVSVGTLGLVKATVLNGSDTMGALLVVQDSANAGDLTHEPHIVTGANATSITYTLTAGSDTADGFAVLPYILAA
jgi:hypothetical protein